MRNADHFYPGFEHAGLETRFDRFLTCTLCQVVMTAEALRDIVAGPNRYVAPSARDTYDG